MIMGNLKIQEMDWSNESRIGQLVAELLIRPILVHPAGTKFL